MSAADTNSEGATASLNDAGSLFDETTVHSIEVTFDEDAFAQLLADFEETGDKTWIEATVTIDGTTYEQAGLRLKGHSTLRNVGTGASAEDLPWLIDLDEYVEGQDHDGVDEFVVRTNKTVTALNEAVSLDLLEAAGLSSQQAVATRFSVNGGDAVLRLVVEHPDGNWIDDWFGTDGSLYKAESSGDYSYRGDDASAYEDVFDLEAGDDEALTNLTSFLRFINESDDATFTDELYEHLDVEAFATYLAMMELLGNYDDIDGPGNNSYLYYDPETGLMTVVPWDLNLTFGISNRPNGGTTNGGGGAGGGAAGGGAGQGGGVGRGGGGGESNILVERFLETEEFAAAYEDALARLQADLVDSGIASELIAARVEVLTSGASDLVDSNTVSSEAESITEALS